MRIFAVVGAVVSLALAACGGTVPVANIAGASSPAKIPSGSGGSGELTLVLPPILQPNAAISWSSKPRMLANGVQYARVWVAGRVFGPFLVLQPNCTAGPVDVNCRITLTVPAGRDRRIRIQAYATSDKAAQPLAEGSITKNIYANSHSTYAVPMVGIAHSLGVRTLNSSFTLGQAVSETVIAVGIDADNHVIPSVAVVGERRAPLPPVEITYSGFASGTLSSASASGSQTQFPCCGELPPTFAYDGSSTGTETFTISAHGYPSQSVTMQVVTGNATLAPLLATTGAVEGPSELVQFPLAASGDEAPTRALEGESGDIYGEDAAGNYWAGATQYSNAGRVLGITSFPQQQTPFARDAKGNIYTAAGCSIYEYAVVNFVATPVREVDSSCQASFARAIDGAGDIYISLNSYDPNQPPAVIEEFAAGPSAGSISPTRVIPMPSASPGTYYETQAMDTDAAGNLYVAIDYFNVGPQHDYRLYEIAPGSTSVNEIMSGVPIVEMAVDDNGDVYARTYTENTLNAIQVFPAGSTASSQMIAGPNTQLVVLGPIAVPKSWTTSAARRRSAPRAGTPEILKNFGLH